MKELQNETLLSYLDVPHALEKVLNLFWKRWSSVFISTKIMYCFVIFFDGAKFEIIQFDDWKRS